MYSIKSCCVFRRLSTFLCKSRDDQRNCPSASSISLMTLNIVAVVRCEHQGGLLEASYNNSSETILENLRLLSMSQWGNIVWFWKTHFDTVEGICNFIYKCFHSKASTSIQNDYKYYKIFKLFGTLWFWFLRFWWM